MDSLINRVQSGDNIILKKVAIDKYHKSQVDLVNPSYNSAETAGEAQPALPLQLPARLRQQRRKHR
jgi:hypothetical protein